MWILSQVWHPPKSGLLRYHETDLYTSPERLAESALKKLMGRIYYGIPEIGQTYYNADQHSFVKAEGPEMTDKEVLILRDIWT